MMRWLDEHSEAIELCLLIIATCIGLGLFLLLCAVALTWAGGRP